MLENSRELGGSVLSQSVTWPLAAHTQAKHEILSRYLQAWLPIMTSYNERVLIIDGFAGPGEYVGGEIGSPLIMIDAFLNHGYTPVRQKEVVFLFIEKDRDSCSHLEDLLEQRKSQYQFPPKASFHVFQGTFKDTLNDLLKYLADNRLTMAPTFAFIDPFGYSHAPLSIIQGLMRHPKSEVLITANSLGLADVPLCLGGFIRQRLRHFVQNYKFICLIWC